MNESVPLSNGLTYESSSSLRKESNFAKISKFKWELLHQFLEVCPDARQFGDFCTAMSPITPAVLEAYGMLPPADVRLYPQGFQDIIPLIINLPQLIVEDLLQSNRQESLV